MDAIIEIPEDGSHPKFVATVEAINNDPHGVFAQIRDQVPFFEMPLGSIWVMTYDHVDLMFSDTLTRQVETEAMTLRGINDGPIYDFYNNAMLFSNGAVHRRRRAPLSKSFAYGVMETLRPRVRTVAHALIDAYADAGEMDFLEEFARQVPTRIICDMLGVPLDDFPKFRDWVDGSARAIGLFPEADIDWIATSVTKLNGYVAELLDDRRRSPKDDFLTDYVRTVDEAGDLSPEEICVQIAGAIMAGSDTTRTGIAVLISNLLNNREQWEAVCRDPGLIPGAVSEGLRYDPPVGSLARIATTDIDVEGRTVETGRIVFLSLVSALRDPAVYPDPHRFDIRREHPRHHMAFGGGSHRCLGAALARVELEECLRVLAERLPGLQLKGGMPRLTGHSGIREIDRMAVVWEPEG